MKIVHITGAEILADCHTGTDGKAVEEKDHHVGDHGGGADGGKCLLAHKITDDNRVNGVIEHLEDIAEHKRQ